MWNRRMEHELLLPVIDVFVHTHRFWVGKREQVPIWGEAARKAGRAHALARPRARGPEFIGVDRYDIADITAQVALLTARGVLQLPIPEDHKNLSRWWTSVSKRPTARA